MKYSLVVVLILIPPSAFAQTVDPEQPPRPPFPPSINVPPPLPTPTMSRSGLTFEANLGLGLVWARVGRDTDTTPAFGGLDIGFGAWLNDDVALGLRIAGMTFGSTDSVRVTAGYFGPALQYWSNNQFWVGGGAGLAFVSAHIGGTDLQLEPAGGVGLDLRAGYTFNHDSENTFNLSIESNLGFFSLGTGVGGSPDVNINSLSLLFGYQHL